MIKLSGILDYSMGGFLCLRGFASFKLLSCISEPNAEVQRELIESHKGEMAKFLNDGEYRFFPEVILSLNLTDGKSFYEQIEKLHRSLQSGETWNKTVGNFQFSISQNITKNIIGKYDPVPRIVRTNIAHIKFDETGEKVNRIVTYTYNEKGALIKKSTAFMKDRPDLMMTQKLGTSAEEYEYDLKGCIVKTTKYNILGSSNNISAASAENCFTNLCEYDARRNIIVQHDATGIYTTTYDYNSNNTLINKVTMPNGVVFNYSFDGRDRATKVSCTVNGVDNYNSTGYELNEVVELNHSGQRPISYEFDEKRRLSKIYLNGGQYESLEYENNVYENEVKVDKLKRTNAKNETFTAVVNKLGTSAEIYYGDNLTSDYKYNVRTNIATKNDYLSGGVTTVTYDSCGNMLQSKEEIWGEEITENYEYNSKGQLVKVKKSYSAKDDTFTYDDWLKDCVTEMTAGEFSVVLNHDADGRYTGKTVYSGNFKLCEESINYLSYTKDFGTMMPGKLNSNGVELSYNYDEQGNIVKISNGNTVKAKYTYDGLKRLIREDNRDFNTTKLYSYDNNGNLIKREETAYKTGSHTAGTGKIITYKYSGDRLISYNGERFVYDSVGNPIIYRGKAATWTMGRRLASYNGNTFKYNADGKRIEKNGIKYYYDSRGRLIMQGDNLEFLYDTTGLLGFKYFRAYYLYKKDIQGNIVGIISDLDKKEVVTYTYDAWGNYKIGGDPEYRDIAELNPFRYRGYYYDEETGLYYLQSRYYDPEIGRFMTIDSINYADVETINGLNLYAYCGNNPVNNIDPEGHLFLASLLLVGAAILLFTPIGGAVVQTVVSVASYGGAAVASIWDEDIRNDMNAIHWNPFNGDESAVMGSNKVSFYKGVPVFSVNNKGGSMSLGAIWFDKSQGAEVLKHERGHNTQLMSMGLGNYILQIGIPSLCKNDDNTPWELSASILGDSGLSSSATDKEKMNSSIYFSIATIPILNIANIFWYIFY